MLPKREEVRVRVVRERLVEPVVGLQQQVRQGSSMCFFEHFQQHVPNPNCLLGLRNHCQNSAGFQDVPPVDDAGGPLEVVVVPSPAKLHLLQVGEQVAPALL